MQSGQSRGSSSYTQGNMIILRFSLKRRFFDAILVQNVAEERFTRISGGEGGGGGQGVTVETFLKIPNGHLTLVPYDPFSGKT